MTAQSFEASRYTPNSPTSPQTERSRAPDLNAASVLHSSSVKQTCITFFWVCVFLRVSRGMFASDTVKYSASTSPLFTMRCCSCSISSPFHSREVCRSGSHCVRRALRPCRSGQGAWRRRRLRLISYIFSAATNLLGLTSVRQNLT